MSTNHRRNKRWQLYTNSKPAAEFAPDAMLDLVGQIG